jgi:armadillo repeat-containing protein 8
LINSQVIPPLLTILSDPYSRPRLRLESLRTLGVIVSYLHDDPLEDYAKLRMSVYDQIITESITVIRRILEETTKSRLAEEQFTLVLQLIRRIVEGSPSRKASLVQAGILDILASKLAVWVITYQQAFKGDYPLARLKLSFPPPQACFCDLILAIASIVQGSAYRSFRVFYSQDILAVFPTAPSILSAELHSNFTDSFHPSVSHPWDRLLPQLTGFQPKTDSEPKGFPALHSFGSAEQSRIPFVAQNFVSLWPRRSDEYSSNLVAWLVHMARSSQGQERVSILWLLAVLLKETRLNERFGKPLSLLVLPILIRMITDEPSHYAANDIKSEYPAELILAELIQESDMLQCAAYDAGAIKAICTRLKKAFDPAKMAPPTMWSPTPGSSSAEQRSLSSDVLLGPPTPCPALSTTIRYRAIAMRALAALTETQDRHRRDAIGCNVMPCVIDAMTSYPPAPAFAVSQLQALKPIDTIDAKDGNPTFVIMAALHFLTVLSRSTHILRTSLIDANVASPVYALLEHEDLPVRIAAVDVTINLVLHFSPMKPVSPPITKKTDIKS